MLRVSLENKYIIGFTKEDEGSETPPTPSIPSGAEKVLICSISYTKNLTACLFHFLVVSCQNDKLFLQFGHDVYLFISFYRAVKNYYWEITD